MISFTIPGKPVGKGRPRFARRGNFVQTYTPEKTASYEKLVKMLAMQEMGDNKPTLDPVYVNILVFICPPVSWSKKKRIQAYNDALLPCVKPDTDNVIKLILDAMNGIVYNDDKQVTSLNISKRYACEDKVIVTMCADGRNV